MARNKSGFTLLEVMVALAIVAIALGAAGIRLEQLVALYSSLTREGQVAMPVWKAAWKK